MVLAFMLDDVLELAFVFEKPSSVDAWLVEPARVGGLCIAERAMYVSMHLAVVKCQSRTPFDSIPIFPHTNDGILKLAGLVQVEELASAEGEYHALIVFLQLIIDLCSQKRSQLAVRE